MTDKKRKQLDEDRADYAAMLDDAKSSAEEKEWAGKKIKEIDAELAGPAATPASSEPAAAEAAPAPSGEKKKKKAHKATAKKERKSKKKEQTAEPDCDTLLQKFRDRRSAAAASAHKTKTKSIFEKVSDKVESAVVGAIKSIPAEALKKNPSKLLKEFEIVKRSAKRFLESFKTLLKDDYAAKEISEALNGVEKVIDSLEKKYAA